MHRRMALSRQKKYTERKMEGVETKAQSHGQDSQITSKNLEGFQQRVNEIINLIKEDENFSEMTVEIYDSKKSKLAELVTELSRMYGAIADQQEHSIKEVSNIKTEHVGSSKSESFMSINKQLNSPINKDALKVKGKKVIHDSDVLLKKISSLEKEVLSSKKKIQDLTDENAILEAGKANATELNEMISNANRKIEAMGNVIEGSRRQLKSSDAVNFELRQELSAKVVTLNQKIETLGKLFDKEEARNQELQEKVSLCIAEIAKRDEQIMELNTEVNLLKNSHAAEEERLNADIERLNTQLMEKCELVDDLTLKHDALLAYTMDKIGR